MPSLGDDFPLKERIRELAAELGFAACAFTTSAPLSCAATLEAWLDEGRNGLMDYLARGLERRVVPRSVMQDACTIIVVAFPYPPGPAPDPRWRETLTGRVAAYARGGDYHVMVESRLAQFGEQIARFAPARFQTHVDAGPLVEKELARRAGLGWYGRNTNVLTKSLGSYFLLGCLLTSLEVEPDPPFVEDHCGTCRACIPACPTGALDSGPTIDARRCISYLTIELRGPIPASLRPLIGNWVFGCDDCQTACPWSAPPDPSDDMEILRPSLPALLRMNDTVFSERYRDTVVARVRRRGLARNAAIALGNSGNPDAVEPLARALREDPEPIVRSAAAWALGQIPTPSSRRALTGHPIDGERTPVAAEIRAALARQATLASIL
jgi:epoxyqueuosine reductase